MGRFYRPESRHFIPIVNDRRELVGWTEKAPEYVGLRLRHPEAEELVGPIRCLYVEIDAKEDARKAGAPPSWIGPWRCLALCSASIYPNDSDGLVRAVIAARGAGRGGQSKRESTR